MTEIQLSYLPDSEWNKRLENSSLGTIYQTKEYGLYFNTQYKSKPIFLKFYSAKGELVGQIVVFQSFLGRRKLAKLFGRGFIYSAVAKTSGVLPKYTNWFFGPIIFDTSYQNEISESFANLLASWKSKFYGSTHPLNGDFNFPHNYNIKKENAATFIIDLSKSLESIFYATDKKSVQKNIKRSEERGVSVTQISSRKDIIIYHELLNKHRLDKNLVSYSLDDVIQGYELLHPMGQTGFLAWYNEIPIGGIFISSFNNYINEWGIARSQIDTEKKLYSLDLLRWKVIEWGIQNKCKYYDLSGVKSTHRSEKDEALFRNKAKWGGKLVNYGTFSK